MSIGFKGMLNAAKTMAATAIDIYTKPEILIEAKKEFDKRTASGYVCPIPSDAKPTVAD